MPRLTIPESAERARLKRNARQKRWRDGARRRAQAAAIVDHVMNLDGTDAPAPPRPDLPPGDLALLLRDRFHKVINGLTDEELLNKDFAPALALGLKAQGTLDAREKVKAKGGKSLELVAALFGLLNPATPPMVSDGLTIEGEAYEVEG